MRRTPTCIGLDADNKAYLDSRNESNAEIINNLIRVYREHEEGVQPSIVSGELIVTISEANAALIERQNKLAKTLLNTIKPGRIAAIKKNPEIVDRGYLVKLQNLISWELKFMPTTDRVRDLLREVVDESKEVTQ